MTHNWAGLTGHRRQRDYLSKSIAANRLAHAYIFAGPQHVGKRTVARRLAQILICREGTACLQCPECTSFAAGSHADYLELGGEDALKVEAVRELAYKLALKPYAGRRKVAVVDNAENLTIEASNALLKVLEEPKSHTLLILITDNARRLLPTIASRAQKIQFAPVPKAEAGDSAIPELDNPYAAGKPGWAQTAQSDPGMMERFRLWGEQYRIFAGDDAVERLKLAADLAGAESTEIRQALDYWLHHLERELADHPTSRTVARIRAVTAAQRLADQNVNAKLLLSQLMLKS